MLCNCNISSNKPKDFFHKKFQMHILKFWNSSCPIQEKTHINVTTHHEFASWSLISTIRACAWKACQQALSPTTSSPYTTRTAQIHTLSQNLSMKTNSSFMFISYIHQTELGTDSGIPHLHQQCLVKSVVTECLAPWPHAPLTSSPWVKTPAARAKHTANLNQRNRITKAPLKSCNTCWRSPATPR